MSSAISSRPDDSAERITYSRMEPVQRDMLSVLEAAHVMGIGRTKVYRLISEGKLKTVKNGGRRLIRRSEIERFNDSLIDSLPLTKTY
jgi:excisionase family DNA binding protein